VQDLGLACAERIVRSVQRGIREIGVDDLLPAGDLSDGIGHGDRRRLLGHQTVGARRHHPAHIAHAGPFGHHQRVAFGQQVGEHAGRAEPVHARHVAVDDRNVGDAGQRRLDDLVSPVNLGYHVDVGLLGEKRDHPPAH
jgi:hypothetical protein